MNLRRNLSSEQVELRRYVCLVHLGFNITSVFSCECKRCKVSAVLPRDAVIRPKVKSLLRVLLFWLSFSKGSSRSTAKVLF